MQAQQLKGLIVNKNGQPIPNSTVYIYENSRGIAADDLGEFQTILEEGIYTCEFRSLGYQSLKKTITMGEQNQTVRIELQETSYMLNEVVVFASNEDPAYRIMRKAIAYAPYYRYQIARYSSEAYIKGSLTIEKIPGIFKRAMKVNDKKFDIESFIGKPLVLESKSKIDFVSPETYNQQVIALKTSIPKEFDATKGLSIMTSSIYNPEFGGKISPLAKGAFRFYAFKLENVDYKPDYIVNKIKVIPRKKNPNLFSGYIYILEDTWNVYLADLVTSELGTKLHYRINYHQVKPSVYLPTTYDFAMQMNMMGIKLSGRYYASMKYNSIEVDQSKKAMAVPDEALPENYAEKKVSPKQQKILNEIEKLSQKEQLTTKEAYKMSKLMTKVTEPDEIKKQRESLEIKDIENVKMEVDSLAWHRDTTYWNTIRELPLRSDELKSYQIKDSLALNDSVFDNKSDNVVLSIESNPKTVFGKIMQGGYWKMNDKSSLRYSGILGSFREYNFVDGFWLGQALSFNYSPNKTSRFSLTPMLYYTTAREAWLWHVSSSFHYAPMSLGQLNISGGHISRDVNSENGESRLMNTLTSIGLGQNFIRFYDSRYIQVSNSVDVANGLRLFTGFEMDKRAALNNRVSFNFMKKEISENIPSHADAYPEHTAANITLGLSYTPFYRYRVRNDRKMYVSSKYPTFSVLYKKGVNLLSNNSAPLYDRLSLTATQSIQISPFESLSYMISAGTFLSANNLYLNDLKYFNNNQMLFTKSDFDKAFNLLPAYAASDKWWTEWHVNFQSQYLFIKNLPFLQRFSFDEAVHIHGLSTENQKFYLESGYSIGFLGLGRVGVFTNFFDKKFNNFGVRISYPLWSIIEKPIK